MATELEQYFEFKCWKGLEVRGLKGKDEYEDRLRFEITTIEKMGFAGYFLIVSDFLNWARSQDIPVGPGRGSAAGSLVAFAMGITDLDPIRFGLLFERFLNPARVSMTDIDCDFCEKRRDEVIQYVIGKYGADHVAQIGTFGTMKAKGAIRDVARTLGHHLSLSTKLAKLIPPPVHGKVVPLAKAYEQVAELKNWHSQPLTPEGEILNWADKVENNIKSYGIHASGVVISPVPLTKLIPLATGARGEQSTQLEMTAIEDVGLIKFDFLGLKTLTMIKVCTDLIEKLHGVKIDINNIHNTHPKDEKTFENLREGDTCGIFQLETSSGMKDLLIKIIPTDLEDVCALVAIYRPGPLASAGLKMYLAARSGKSPPTYIAPELEGILGVTSGFLIYQEQAMQIARTIAGFSLAEADLLRRAMGKKKQEEMDKLKQKFIDGALSRGFTEEVAVSLFNDIDAFSSYGFNRAHSACYGVIAYQTAYLKTHYPVEFMCAALTCDYENVDKVIKYIAECRRMGIPILPPDINKSESGFTIDSGAIRFGLSAIKHLGEEPVSYITTVRESGFHDILDFAQRVDLGKINRKKLESLVSSGAFDESGHTRTSLLATIDQIWDYKQEVKKCDAKTVTFFKRLDAWSIREAENAEAEKAGMKKKPALKKPEKPLAPSLPVIPIIQEMDDQELLSREKELLGYYISGHPLDSYSSAISGGDFVSTEDLHERDSMDRPVIPHGYSVRIPGIITSIEEKQTKKGPTMAFLILEDKTGTINVTIFPGAYNKNKHVLEEGKPIILAGKVEREEDEDSEEISTALPPKIIAFDVAQLISGEIRHEPIDVEIDPKRSADLLKLFEKYPGDACQINVFFRTNSAVFKVNKVFSIGGNRGSFLRDLGRIVI